MIIVSFYYSVKPGTRPQVMEMAKACVDATRKEKGCVTYTQYPSMENEQDMFAFEVWETKEDLMAHSKTEHYAEFNRQRKPILIEESRRMVLFEGEETTL